MGIGPGRTSRRSVRKEIRLFGKLRTELSVVFERGARRALGLWVEEIESWKLGV
ncbi:hypothetical protein FVEG_16001 [Fusarium verticillioides 7600]|uniref:Uncharacterized protein n=1 Tax=Gibberella moniliformis (strain M3125 / FGSC 7600) TaxID=334819 RepID=W7MPN6_GIBM7|nr:hypothetical protein FVEG_16001 [Fusarium verticillioides 7600]EWG46597.1 hypothetical protein FVEG_16001 [Fusarium verticillioides 7600]